MRIVMKRRDIWFGYSDNPSKCPVARALNRATGERWAVYDNYATKLFERPVRAYPLPESVTTFVRAIDSGATVKPISFQFDSIRKDTDA